MTEMTTKRKAAKRKKPEKSPYSVLQFQVLGREVSVGIDEKLKLSYTVEADGKTYGNAVVARSQLPIDVLGAAFLLASNAADTINGFASEK